MADGQPVVLDTCVLAPSRLRDFLLSLAGQRAYYPLWNGAILDELEHLERRRHTDFGLSETEAGLIARRLIEQMSTSFDGSSSKAGNTLIDGTSGLRDPHDEHVVAAAVVARSLAEYDETCPLRSVTQPVVFCWWGW